MRTAVPHWLGIIDGTATEYVTVLEGIRRYVGDDVRIFYSVGAELAKDRTEGLGYRYDRLSEARIVAAHSDVVFCAWDWMKRWKEKKEIRVTAMRQGIRYPCSCRIPRLPLWRLLPGAVSRWCCVCVREAISICVMPTVILTP